MPQLKSGRHVALSATPYLDALASANDDSAYFAIVALRLHASTPGALRDHLVIEYFLEGEGTPPNAPTHPSGYCVADVLEGRSDWTTDEVAEFRQFIEQEPRFGAWLQSQFDEIDHTIRKSPHWESELQVLDELPDGLDVATIKRAIIQKSAMEFGAMAQLRGVSTQPVAEPLGALVDGESPVAEAQPLRQSALPDELRDLILAMARREDVHSVSCQFRDAQLWEGLLQEQVRRARLSGKPPRDAFFLCGPDGGIPGIAKMHPGLEDLPEDEWFTGDTLEEKLGGRIHIPYEGVCGADLFVYPSWRAIYPEHWTEDGAELDWATAMKPCNHLLIERDLGEPSCATRTGPIAGTWWLYSSNAPYKPCSPFHQAE